MASFPTTPITYANRSAGQKIASAHMNSVQDEIAAIEAGYLGGTAPLNSSNSTAANLSVTGGSTLATLEVAGGSTFAGPVTFSTGITFSTLVFPRVPHALLTNTSTRNIVGNGTWLGLNWDNALRNDGAMHSTSANSSRITFTASTGLYAVMANVTLSTVNAGFFQARLMTNDDLEIAREAKVNDNANQMPLSMVGVVRAADLTDYVTVQVRGTGATSTGFVFANSTGTPVRFAAHFISK